jgi:Nucleoside-diphosphate-sugar pyrophosphorylase involved in lipopolysaccharide biosynthesis/translation initiation factor 2B, gamma/epsilon subunits (eIF-2Bgamma/eIF-2Bepsilon)
MDTNYLIKEDKTLLDALKVINSIDDGPLVLFAVNDKNQMVGTLTDGDVRRALIAGCSVDDKLSKACHRNFNFLRFGETDTVENLHKQKKMKMKLVPILDSNNHLIDVINLERYYSRLPIDAILMAGGKGLRLRPLTESIPKPLLKVGDKAIIDHNVDRLIDFGVKNISVTVNYLAEQLEEHYSILHNDIKVNCIREPKFLGTIGAVQFVPQIINDTVLVMNSDLFTNIDYEDFYLHFVDNKADMSVAAVPYSVSVPYGIFELEGRNITGVKEKPLYNYFANAGIYLFKKSVLEFIPQDEFFNATDLIEKLVSLNKIVIRYPITGFWLDIGNKEEYAKANEFVKHLN